MNRLRRILVCTAGMLLSVSVTSGQEFSEELQRGQKLLDRIAQKPPNARQVFAETMVGDKTVGYATLRLEPHGKKSLEFKIEAVLELPAARISGLVNVISDLKTQPSRIEFHRVMQPNEGTTVTQHKVIEEKDGKLKITTVQGEDRQSDTRPMPKEPFFGLTDMLVLASDIGKISEPVALHDLDPDTGELRMLVFRPSSGEDGEIVINVLVKGEKPEATYRFSKEGKLLAWSEAGAPAVLKVVDEKRARALRKQFGPPDSQTAATKAE